MVKPELFFESTDERARELLDGIDHVWELLPRLPDLLAEWPAYIGPGAVVRHGAYIRANCVLLAGAVLGHASEMKNSVLLPGAKAPHFAYVGDSILGNRVNLGAGTKLSNATVTGSRSVCVTVDGIDYDTGVRKLGAIIGDDTRLGCNIVTNPGTLLGPRVIAYPGTSIRGYHPAGTILKLRQQVEASEQRAGGSAGKR